MGMLYADYQQKLIDALKKETGVPTTAIHAVWFSKVLTSSKGLFIIDETTGYYEVTYNGHTNQIYIDQYGQVAHSVIELEGE